MQQLPDVLPILSAGGHQRPEDGACFMEFASVLAGEPFSDHPVCTHPVLAAVARVVNDCSTDAGRQALAPLIPAVIGTTDTSPRVGAELVAVCCRAALALAPRQQRPVLTVALRRAEHRAAAKAAAEASAEAGRTHHGLMNWFRRLRRWESGRDAAEISRALGRAVPRGREGDKVMRELLADCIDRYYELTKSDERRAVAGPTPSTSGAV